VNIQTSSQALELNVAPEDLRFGYSVHICITSDESRTSEAWFSFWKLPKEQIYW